MKLDPVEVILLSAVMAVVVLWATVMLGMWWEHRKQR